MFSRATKVLISMLVAIGITFSLIPDSMATTNVHDCATSSDSCISGLSLGYGDDALSLKATWSSPINGNPSGYYVYLYTGSDYSSVTPSAAVGSAREVTFNNLVEGTVYSVAVMAQYASPVAPENKEFFVSKSTPATVLDEPAAPVNVIVSRTGSGQVSITWDAVTDTGGSPIAEYQVTCISTCTSSELGVQDLNTEENYLSLSNLSTNTARTFTVVAKNSTFTSDQSAASNSITPFSNPTAPSSLTATAGDGAIAVSSWGASSVTGADLTKYVVITYLSTDLTFSNPIPGKTVTVTNLSSRSASISGLTNGTGYVVRVAGYVGDVAGAFRTSSSLTPVGVPSAPTPPTASRTDSTATVSWNAPASNGAVIDYYNVSYSTSESGSFSTPASGTCATDVSVTSCTMTGLTQGSTYYFKVRAHNSAGLSGFSGASAGLSYPNPTQNVIQTSSSPALTAQSAPVSLPAALKAKKKLSFPIKSSSGAALTVSVSGSCKVTKVFKTVKVKVGKKTKKVKQQTGWSVQVLKKGKACEIRQTSPESNGYAALSASSQILIK